jgi:8-amino-7-oxononanoate synthase
MNEDRKRLAKNSKYLQKRLRDNGFNVIKSSTPIISLIVGDEKTAIEYSKRLLEVGIYIPAIRPPTVKKGTSRLRIVLMSTHSEQDLKEALEKIIKIGIDLKVNTNKIKY